MQNILGGIRGDAPVVRDIQTVTDHHLALYQLCRYQAAVIYKEPSERKLEKTFSTTGHFNIELIIYCFGNSQLCVYNTQSKSDWMFNTQPSVLQVDWLILENNEKATSINNRP